MKQTPVHELHNADLLRLMPLELNNIVEVGCSSGAFAREYKKMNSQCHYTMPLYWHRDRFRVR